MSEIKTEPTQAESEKPAQVDEDVTFPPFPEPTDDDFDEEVNEEEKVFYKTKFEDLNTIVYARLHCTACDRHLGCSPKNDSRMKIHPMLRTLVCHTCHSFYNSGEFDKGDDGSELYCRWCGQGGQVYCCSDCPHVFCAKCIKRNFGLPKIKAIENTDDWKCFKCNPSCLWDLRAICWALLRYCDLKNKILDYTQDPELKLKYEKSLARDISECCKNKRRREKSDPTKKKEIESLTKKIISKMPSTIQVKKFASMNNMDEPPKLEKKAQKRPASPKMKSVFISNPIAITPCTVQTVQSPPIKKYRMAGGANLLNPIRFANEKKLNPTLSPFPRLAPRQRMHVPIIGNLYNAGNFKTYGNINNIVNDNINLSLDNLTQGLDLASVENLNGTQDNDDVVCTPDFPLEPLCEVTEDNDDDVQCMTPGPVATPKVTNPPPLAQRGSVNNENIIQMTENDVTVNSLTGGLKFRVDPQTLSSNKMYRLPDGRVFAINVNANMPGGYSATIVSVSDTSGNVAPKGETFAAKLSTIAHSSSPTSSVAKTTQSNSKNKRKTSMKNDKNSIAKEGRECDMKVPVEWYRYNLIDAVDALEYSLSRLNKLKKEATTVHLRTRTLSEMKYLHRTLEQLLCTSSKRFIEIRESLNKEFRQYITKKEKSHPSSEEEDDDVLILPDPANDDPIFIDENSMESVNENDRQEVDLTEIASSDHNNSNENRNNIDPLQLEQDESYVNATNNAINSILSKTLENITKDFSEDDIKENNTELNKNDCEVTDKCINTNEFITDLKCTEKIKCNENPDVVQETSNNHKASKDVELNKNELETTKTNDAVDIEAKDMSKEKTDNDNDEQIQDTDMSEEMIENLLKDSTDVADNINNLMEISELGEAQ